MDIQFNKKQLNKIRKEHNLSLIVLHGSCVDGKIHSKSDIDIAVLRNGRKKKLKLLELIKNLVHVCGEDNIDITDLTSADPLLLYAVVKKSRLLSGSTDDFNSLLKLAYQKYNDYLPYLNREKEFVKERIKSYVAA